MIKALLVGLWLLNSLVGVTSNADASAMGRVAFEPVVNAVIIERCDAKMNFVGLLKDIRIDNSHIDEERLPAANDIHGVCKVGLVCSVPKNSGIRLRLTRNGEPRKQIASQELISFFGVRLPVWSEFMHFEGSDNLQNFSRRLTRVLNANLTSGVIDVAGEFSFFGGQITSGLSLSNLTSDADRILSGISGVFRLSNSVTCGAKGALQKHDSPSTKAHPKESEKRHDPLSSGVPPEASWVITAAIVTVLGWMINYRAACLTFDDGRDGRHFIRNFIIAQFVWALCGALLFGSWWYVWLNILS